MIDIEQHTLRAFKQNSIAAFACFVEPLPHGLGILQHRFCNLTQIPQQPFPVNRLFAKTGAQCVMVRAQPV